MFQFSPCFLNPSIGVIIRSAMHSHSSLSFLAVLLRLAAGELNVVPSTAYQNNIPLVFLSADPNDWVNPAYVLSTSQGPADTSAAQNQIVAAAGWTAKKGPWCECFLHAHCKAFVLSFFIAVANGTIIPPSGNIHDYLSWAP